MWSMSIGGRGRGIQISIGMKNGDRRAVLTERNDESNRV